jgi:hypothetical protein
MRRSAAVALPRRLLGIFMAGAFRDRAVHDLHYCIWLTRRFVFGLVFEERRRYVTAGTGTNTGPHVSLCGIVDEVQDFLQVFPGFSFFVLRVGA